MAYPRKSESGPDVLSARPIPRNRPVPRVPTECDEGYMSSLQVSLNMALSCEGSSVGDLSDRCIILQ